MKWVRLSDWIEERNGESVSLLTGNGFSLAYRNDLFNVANFEQAYIDAGLSELCIDLMRALRTYSTESLSLCLEKAKLACEVYGIDHAGHFDADISALPSALVSAITMFHPANANDDREKISTGRRFLQLFSVHYTLNFDLLNYWARAPRLEEGTHKFLGEDGFSRLNGKLTWSPANKSVVWYLHGALHLFQERSETGEIVVEKMERVGDDNLLPRIYERITSGNLPVFVSEAESLGKVRVIESNPYLRYGLRVLRNANGAMCVYGCSFSEQDEHIVAALLASNVKSLAIGSFGKVIDPGLAGAVDRLSQGKDVVMFDSSEVNPWEDF